MRKTEIESRVTQVTVVPKDSPLFDERATRISIADEAAGEFVLVEQENGKICIDPAEWGMICASIGNLIAQCRPVEDKQP